MVKKKNTTQVSSAVTKQTKFPFQPHVIVSESCNQKALKHQVLVNCVVF